MTYQYPEKKLVNLELNNINLNQIKMANSKFCSSKRTGSFILASFFFFTFFILASFTTIIAQTGTDFSGTWVLNESKSTQPEGGFRMAPVSMVITQDGINLTVERTSNGPNGDEFKSTAKFRYNVRKSIVKWSPDKKSLVFDHSMTFERDGQTNEFKSSETWKLNADKSLAVETVFNTPNGEMSSTNVYDKK
jgi:hypothetical protein